jgi:hypothetical protein
VDNLGRLPACPRLCRGEECTGTPCGEEEPGFPYAHIADMVVCTDKAHESMATKAGCLMFHHWPKRSPRAPPAGAPKNSGGGTSGARQAPPKRHAGKGTQQQRQQQPRGQQQQQRDMDHRRFVIERLNLELEVARTTGGARTNGRGAFTSPPPHSHSRHHPNGHCHSNLHPRTTSSDARQSTGSSLCTSRSTCR